MRARISHALRFAVTTLVAVYVAGVAWELFDVFVRGEVANGFTAAATFRFNEVVWRTVAGVGAVTVFLLRLGDLNATPPSWRFAWALAAWVAASSVVIASAVEEGRWGVGIVCLVAAVGAWLLFHRRVPGWPGGWRGAPPRGGSPAERGLGRDGELR
jgi:hypothetical protein